MAVTGKTIRMRKAVGPVVITKKPRRMQPEMSNVWMPNDPKN